VTVNVPALRQRKEDIPSLAQQILSDLAASVGRRVRGFSADAIAMLEAYPWPGNVRELRNAIEHALTLGDSEMLTSADFPEVLHRSIPMAEAGPGVVAADDDSVRLPMPLSTLERKAVEAALRATNGNRSRAAAVLGIPRSTLYNKLLEFSRLDGLADSE
jgi:DNA-binding NtrC family response regulator